MQWDTFKTILAVTRAGSFAKAASGMNVDRTTIMRKVKKLEDQLGFPVFERRSGNYTLTVEAEKVLLAAEKMESEIIELERLVAGEALHPSGNLRVTTTDAIFLFEVAPKLQEFQKRYPRINLQMVINNHQLSLSRREADIAIRTGKVVPAHLVGYSLGELHFGIYASQAYIDENSTKNNNTYHWIGLDEPMLSAPPGQWLSKNVNPSQIVITANSFLAISECAKAHMGVALLPCRLGDVSKSLVQIGKPIPELSNGLWLVTHPDLENAGRVKAFIEHIKPKQ